MGSIDKITSSTKQIHIANSGDEEPTVIEVPWWNGTVANLTLMALGIFYSSSIGDHHELFNLFKYINDLVTTPSE